MGVHIPAFFFILAEAVVDDNRTGVFLLLCFYSSLFEATAGQGAVAHRRCVNVSSDGQIVLSSTCQRFPVPCFQPVTAGRDCCPFSLRIGSVY